MLMLHDFSLPKENPDKIVIHHHHEVLHPQPGITTSSHEVVQLDHHHLHRHYDADGSPSSLFFEDSIPNKNVVSQDGRKQGKFTFPPFKPSQPLPAQPETSNSIPQPSHIENGGFHPLPPFTMFPNQLPSAQPLQQQQQNVLNPSSYYKMKMQLGNIATAESGKRRPAGSSQDSFDGIITASPSITLPMPGLVTVPVPPSDALALQQVTPHQHYPPHSHSISASPDYEPANPPPPSGHPLQFHFDPFIQNAGDFPDTANENDNRVQPNQPHHQQHHVMQNDQIQDSIPTMYHPPMKYPSTRLQGSSYYYDQQRKKLKKHKEGTLNNVYDEYVGGEHEPERERPFQPSHNEIDDYVDNVESNSHRYKPSQRPKKQQSSVEQDVYEQLDKTPTKGLSSHENISQNPYSETPYVLMFPSLVPEEAMVPPRPKVHGREIPVISAAELHPVPVLPTKNLGPGMEVVPVHPREQMMNVLATKYHDNMMAKYMESKKKPPPNIYTPYGVLVPMGEIGSSPLSSTPTKQYHPAKGPVPPQPPRPNRYEMDKYSHSHLGDMNSIKNMYMDESKSSSYGSVSSALQPAVIDLLADKLAAKLSSLGYAMQQPSHLDEPLSHNFHSDSAGYESVSPSKGQVPMKHNPAYPDSSASSLSTKTTSLHKSISSKGIPKAEFRKYVKDLLREKLEEMLREIELNEKKEKAKSTKADLPNAASIPPHIPMPIPARFPYPMQGQYSQNMPVFVPYPNQSTAKPPLEPPSGKAPTPPQLRKYPDKIKGHVKEGKSTGGFLQSIKKFFSFGNSNAGSESRESMHPNRTRAFHPFQKRRTSPSSSWFGSKTSKNDNFKSIQRRQGKPIKEMKVFPNKNKSQHKMAAEIAVSKNKSNFKEVQKLVHLLLKTGLDDIDGDGDEIVSVEALIKGLDNVVVRQHTNKNESTTPTTTKPTTINRRTDEDFYYSSKMDNNKFMKALNRNNKFSSKKSHRDKAAVATFPQSTDNDRIRRVKSNLKNDKAKKQTISASKKVTFPLQWLPFSRA